MSDNWRPYPVQDYTRVIKQPKRMHRVFWFTVKSGINMWAFYVSLGVATATTAGISAILLGLFNGNPFVVGGGLLGGVAMGIGTYIAMSYRVRGISTPIEIAVNWIVGTIVQPKKLEGFSRDRDPAHVHWQVILWKPTDESWEATRQAAWTWAEYRRRKAEESS